MSNSESDLNTGVRNQYMVALLANMPVISVGILIGWMSPMAPQLQSGSGPAPEPLTDNHVSWMASSPCLMASLGVLIFSHVGQKWGRKKAIILLSVPQAITWMLKIFTTNPVVLILARGLAGLSAGGSMMVIPIYIKEISNDSCRGILGAFMSLSCNMGYILVYTLGSLLSYHTNLWMYLVLPLTHIGLFIWLAPESPAFLVKNGRTEEALWSLAWLRQTHVQNKMIINEVTSLRLEDDQSPELQKVTFTSIVKNQGAFKAFIICFVLMTLLNLSGAFAVLNYASSIFAKAGGALHKNTAAVLIAVVQLCGSFVAISVIDRSGRKILLTVCCIVTCLSMTTLGGWFMLSDRGVQTPSWIPLSAVALCILTNGAGINPLPFIIMAEVFDYQTRAFLSSIVNIYGWLTASVLLFFFKPIVNAFGMSTIFFAFGIIMLLGTIYVIFIVPETKGKSVEAIQQELIGKRGRVPTCEKAADEQDQIKLREQA